MEKVIKVTNPTLVAKIKKILADKEYIHKKIREGKLSEINSEIRFNNNESLQP